MRRGRGGAAPTEACAPGVLSRVSSALAHPQTGPRGTFPPQGKAGAAKPIQFQTGFLLSNNRLKAV